MEKIKFRKTEHLSGCCNDIVIYKEIEDKEKETFSSTPFCNKCKKFPTMRDEDVVRAKKMLDDGSLFD